MTMYFHDFGVREISHHLNLPLRQLQLLIAFHLNLFYDELFIGFDLLDFANSAEPACTESFYELVFGLVLNIENLCHMALYFSEYNYFQRLKYP